MPYLGKTPSQGVRSRYQFTPNAGTTSLSGADANGDTLTFTDGNYVDVYLNGVMLKAGVDYVTTTANTIGSLAATVASDVVDIIVYDTFSLFGGTLEGNVKVNNGTLNVTGATDLDSTLNVDGNATLGGTLGVTGVVTANAGVVVDNITIDGNDISTTNSNGNLTITPNGTGDLYVNSDRLAVKAANDEAATVLLGADNQDDAGDTWKITAQADHTLVFQNDKSGSSDVTHFSITPNATVANSTANFAGNVILPQTGVLAFNSTSDEYIQGAAGILYLGTDNGQRLRIETAQCTVTNNLLVDQSGGTVTLDSNGHVTSHQKLNVISAGGRLTGTTPQGDMARIDLSQTTANAHGGYLDFQTANTSGSLTQALRIDKSQNSTFAGNVALADDKKVTFGAGSDLEIYHDNSSNNDGIIKYQNENGHLKILSGTGGNGGIEIKNRTDNETYLTCVSDGAVTLYHDNAARLATSAAGVTVTGITTSTGFSGKIHPVNGTTTNYLSLKDTNELNFFNSSDVSQQLYIQYDGGNLDLCGSRMIITHGGAIEFNGDIIADQHLRLRTTDDQTNQWYLYTYTDDTFRINYNGIGNDEFVIDTNGIVMTGKNSAGLHTTGWEERATGVVGLSLSSGNSYYFSDGSNYKFYVNANGGIYNYQSNDSNLSDEREKKNIATLGSKWDVVKKWSLKEFHYNSDSDSDSKKCGVIAQDIEDDHPDLITEFELTETNKRKAVKEQQMTWMAIKALQEAMEKIETLEAKVAKLGG